VRALIPPPQLRSSFFLRSSLFGLPKVPSEYGTTRALTPLALSNDLFYASFSPLLFSLFCFLPFLVPPNCRIYRGMTMQGFFAFPPRTRPRLPPHKCYFLRPCVRIVLTQSISHPNSPRQVRHFSMWRLLFFHPPPSSSLTWVT